jgi:diamine N-acetyltransferase
MDNIEFVVADQSKLAEVEVLWNKLRIHHLNQSVHFKERYASLSFQSRIMPLLEKCKNGRLRVEVAWDKKRLIPIGYCISSVVFLTLPEGEIESLNIDDKYRGRKIGSQLMTNALAWMDENEVRHRKIAVVAGNDETIPFYESFGFFAKTIILENKGL